MHLTRSRVVPLAYLTVALLAGISGALAARMLPDPAREPALDCSWRKVSLLGTDAYVDARCAAALRNLRGAEPRPGLAPGSPAAGPPPS